ncbi:hypothetical protein PROFUN_00982 [Planoprotostelium fungivorum]|uniref:Peptidase S53 domain-containing protein n=1 Tax=Planoprotostelium fungivorum TaxID=1890364 RepID=A0A2P6N4C6_9EUKA|nr:hypothetical protein PROFUN_00982 [Planoprotostelium fungivorum]
MHTNVILLVLLALGAFTEARVYVPGRVREFTTSRKHGWTAAGQPAQSEVREFFIALKERNMGEVERIALEISNPDSTSFSQHLSFHELKALTAPHASDVAKVTQWLDSNGIDHERTPSGGHIKIRATVAQVERLFDCKLTTFTHSASAANPIVRSETSYKVPKHLDDIVQFVTPLHGFPKNPLARVKSQPTRKTKPSPNATPVDEITPDIIRSRYNVTAPITNLKVNNTQAVFEIQEGIDPADLQSFFQQFAPKLTAVKVLKYLGDGGNDPTNPGTESSLDIQYISALGGFAPNYYYNYNEDDIYSAFYKYALDLVNDPKPPLVQSISYGQYGGDYPIEEVDRISNEFMKLGARGVTILVASGDDGVGCSDDGSSFEFPYPSTPWVTLIGSTSLQTNDDGSYSEVGATFSTGGFSNDFGIPAWQQAAVDKFLTTPNLPTSYFNASGRALPDVSTVGVGFQVVVGGSTESVDGTSCSAPTFGGMISLINGVRLKTGKKPLGFINPLLYKAATIPQGRAYYDVTSGNNGDESCPGFDAVAGWDPVTGLGTPNFVVLGNCLVACPHLDGSLVTISVRVNNRNRTGGQAGDEQLMTTSLYHRMVKLNYRIEVEERLGRYMVEVKRGNRCYRINDHKVKEINSKDESIIRKLWPVASRWHSLTRRCIVEVLGSYEAKDMRDLVEKVHSRQTLRASQKIRDDRKRKDIQRRAEKQELKKNREVNGNAESQKVPPRPSKPRQSKPRQSTSSRAEPQGVHRPTRLPDTLI